MGNVVISFLHAENTIQVTVKYKKQCNCLTFSTPECIRPSLPPVTILLFLPYQNIPQRFSSF